VCVCVCVGGGGGLTDKGERRDGGRVDAGGYDGVGPGELGPARGRLEPRARRERLGRDRLRAAWGGARAALGRR
jgi:hypothetical protein